MNVIKLARKIIADYFKNEMIFYVQRKLGSDRRWCLRAIQRIFENQTTDEQQQETTTYLNKIGFNGVDAKIMSSIWKFYNKKKFLSPKQWSVCLKLMPKYATQIVQRVPSFRKQDLWKLMDQDAEYQRYREDLKRKKKIDKEEKMQSLFPDYR